MFTFQGDTSMTTDDVVTMLKDEYEGIAPRMTSRPLQGRLLSARGLDPRHLPQPPSLVST